MLPAGVTFPKFNVGEDPRLTFDTEVLTLLTGSRRANTTGHVRLVRGYQSCITDVE